MVGGYHWEAERYVWAVGLMVCVKGTMVTIWDFHFVTDCATVAAAMDCECMIREWHCVNKSRSKLGYFMVSEIKSTVEGELLRIKWSFLFNDKRL
jgi:hypothetical protein